MNNSLITNIYAAKLKGKKQIAVLIDPDKYRVDSIAQHIETCLFANVDFFLVGGSLMSKNYLPELMLLIKSLTTKPIILFPGDIYQIDPSADAILLLSLISGRNPELLIGNHVRSAPYLKQSGLEIIPTGYLLIDGGKHTSVVYMSQSIPIPYDKADIASATALAGQMLGHKIIYLDAGSGALHHIQPDMVNAVSKTVDIPLFVGGGIRKPGQAARLAQAGADIIVVGTAIEQDPALITGLAQAVHESSSLTQCK